MKLTRQIIALAAAAAVLTSCAHRAPLTPTIIGTQPPSNTAPVTFSHPARSAAASASSTEETTRTTAPANAQATHAATSSSTQADPAGSNGEPAQRVITDPQYSPEAINRRAPEQVAWAYITLRMSYSYKDSGPTNHRMRAATFATGSTTTPTPPSTSGAPPQTDWNQVLQKKIQAAVTVTEMDIYPSGPAHTATATQTLIHLMWTRRLSSELNAPVRSSGATTVTLQRQRNGNWLVSNSGFADPN